MTSFRPDGKYSGDDMMCVNKYQRGFFFVEPSFSKKR